MRSEWFLSVFACPLFVAVPLWMGMVIGGSSIVAGQGVRAWEEEGAAGAILPPPPLPHYRFIPFPPEEEEMGEEVVPVRRRPSAPRRRPPTHAPALPTTITISTTTTTTTTTTTPTQSTTTTTPPTPEPCDALTDTELLARLKQQGLFNAIYMASDVFQAAQTFPDLGDRTFTLATGKYECDEKCSRESRFFRRVMAVDSRHSVHRTAPDRLRARAPVTEAPRSWWRPDSWHRRGKRDDGHPEPEETSPTSPSPPPQVREKRSATELAALNTGTTEGVLGTTIALQCDEATAEEVPNTGYHLCRTCRAVRQLPADYFPRVLNEVICAEGDCLRGEGKCRQRFLPFRILKNFGSLRCPHWREVDVQIRTCCDCVIHPNSSFLRYVVPFD